MITLKYLDLFAGIGGFRIAAETSHLKDVSFSPVAYCERDRVCQEFYQKIFKKSLNGEVFVDNAESIRVNNNRNNSKNILLPKFDLLFAGFPCQTFSNIGDRKAFGDSRGQLFFHIVKILSFYRPKYFVLENVQKISTIDKGKVLESMIKSLEDAGYHVYLWDLYADKYGLPQRRRRYFFCGVLKRKNGPKKLLLPPPETDRKKWKYPTVWHLLERNADSRHYIPPRTRLTVLRRNPKWMGDMQIDRPTARPITATMAKWHRANQDNYYSDTYISEKNPNPSISPDIDLNKEPIRRITPLEGFRLQGFPDNFHQAGKRLKISNTSIYRLIGNAVPVNLTRQVIDHFIGSYSD